MFGAISFAKRFYCQAGWTGAGQIASVKFHLFNLFSIVY
jgi:hypothetical protein